MTGILPIKKYGTQSAMTDFREYTMLSPKQLAEYVGFTEQEVKNLCDQSGMNFEEMKRWYSDNYNVEIKSGVEEGTEVFTQTQVMEAWG